MSIQLHNLNEGGSCGRKENSRKCTLHEGKNPKVISKDWLSQRNHSYGNSNWQKLRG